MDLIQITKQDLSKNNKVEDKLIDFTVEENNTKIWLIDPTYTQQQISSESMPSAIGGIATFTEKSLNLKNPIKIFKYPEEFSESLDEYGIPDIIGFSNYMWNSELSLTLARRIKEYAADTIIIMGGPNYPVVESEQESFLKKHPEIDFYIIGEGEVAFANLVAELIRKKLKKNTINTELPSTHYISTEGKTIISKKIERIKDLSEIPSPYLEGKMDKFFDGKLQPVIQTTRGCPFSCTFCVEGLSYYSKIYRNSHEKTRMELEYIGSKMKDVREKGGRNDLWLVDSNFGMYSQDLETCKAIAECQEKYQWPEYIQCDTGKNNKPKVLSAARLVKGAIRLSGSVQSLDPDVLKNIKRSNISPDSLMELAVEAADIDADSRSEIILSLPGESIETHFKTIKTVIDAGFNHANTYQLMMLPGTELSSPETRKQFEMKTRYRILPRCFGYYDVLDRQIIAAEIEEICVSTKTLPFEDYVQCRKMHLMMHIFHNDGLFSSALKFIKILELSPYRWLEILFEEKLEGNIKELFEKYEKETRNELWISKEDLEIEIQKPGTIDSYISGELGYNLLFIHKSIALGKCIQGLQILAFNTLKKLLHEKQKDTIENLSFLKDAINFDASKMTNIFENINDEPTEQFSYNISQFLDDNTNQNIQKYKMKDREKFYFILDSKQKDIINRSLSLYGKSDLGISRILTKVFVKKILRKPMINSKMASIKMS